MSLANNFVLVLSAALVAAMVCLAAVLWAIGHKHDREQEEELNARLG